MQYLSNPGTASNPVASSASPQTVLSQPQNGQNVNEQTLRGLTISVTSNNQMHLNLGKMQEYLLHGF